MQKKQTSFLSSLKFRYFPYWPLFIILIILCGAAAYFYINITPPVYNIAATMSIKDERKGVEDSKLLESLNIYSEKTIVENETEVLHSKKLMRDVVKNLGLYAQISEKGRYRSASAYTSSPVSIVAQDPDKIVDSKTAISFSYNKTNKQVIIGKTNYPLDQWAATPYGVLKFEKNIKQTEQPTGPLSFMLFNVGKLASDLTLVLEVNTSSKVSTIIDLTFKDEVPQRGEDVLNNLIDTYNKTAVDEKTRLASNTLAFLDDRLKSMATELTNIESRIQQFKATKGVVDLSEQGRVYLQNVGDNDQKIADINVQMAVLDQIEDFAKSNDNRVGIVPSVSGVTDPALSDLVVQLNTAELEYEKQRKISGENNPLVTTLHDRIEKLKPDILDNIRTRRNGLVASRQNLSSTNGGYSSSLQGIPQKEKELLEISRQQAIETAVYSSLLQKREETALTYASAVADGRIIDPAQAEEFPESPKKSFVFLAAFVAALGLGIAFISTKELFSSKVLFRSDLDGLLDIPVVAELANIKSKEPIAINSPENFYITEQFRHLRASLGLFSNKKLQKKILITSSIAGEGKSFVSSNLAVSLASTKKKVVLIDLDLRNPKTSQIFKVHAETGTINFLEGMCTVEEIVIKTEYKNLSIVPVGSGDTDPTELLLNEKLNDLFHHLSNEFDYIIIDTAPVDPVADAYLLTEYCDITLFVVRHAYTSKSTLQNLEQAGKLKDLKNPVIVFNSVKSRGFFKKGYGHGYGYGNRYQYDSSAYKMKAITDKKV